MTATALDRRYRATYATSVVQHRKNIGWNNRHPSPLARVGLIGGGQLGLMLAQAASNLDIAIHILDPDASPPAARLSERHVRGDLDDPSAIADLADQCDIVSYEIERGDPQTLSALPIPVEPAPLTLGIIQDKLVQRRHLSDAGIPMPRFAAEADRLPFPLVQKARRGGYDGRGVVVHGAPGEAERPFPQRQLPPSPIPWDHRCYVEEIVDIDAELAVIVARSTVGEVAVYDPVEMHFDPDLNLVDAVIAPANVEETVAAEAREVSKAAVASLTGAGVFAVELFVTRDRRVLVNEIAPRPHNSGHLTIEAHETSQYEQHLRAVLGLPLGKTTLTRPAVMRNVLGGTGTGPTVYRGVSDALAIPETHIHLYGKTESRPGRKMGHVTAVGPDAWTHAERAWRVLSIDGKEER